VRRQPEIAIISPYPPAGERHGGHSGVASYTANLAQSLAEAGAAVTVVAPHLPADQFPAEPTDFDDGDVRVQRRYSFGPGALPRAAAAVAELGVDVVHLQWELFLYGGPAALAGLGPALVTLRRARQPLVTTMHQVLDPSSIDRSTTSLHRVGVPAPLARIGIGSVQRAVAAASSATIVHEHGFRSIVRGSTMIPHGIETVRPLERQLARRRLGLGDHFLALSFGFLAPYKGLELVARASAQAGRDVQVVIAGGEHPRLEGQRYADELAGLGAGTLRFTGRVPDDEVGTLFSAADVALFPYPKPFSASGALALALAHETPVLLSPPLARCIGAPNTLHAEMEPASLAAQLGALAADRARLADLAAWSQVLRVGREWPCVARRHIDLYEEVSDGQRPAGRRLRAA
jgi:glycosyltransferase involved in cell wall biosynthesis